MAMTIGGNAMPANIENFSIGYLFNPHPSLREDGAGNMVAVGYPEVTWTFTELTKAEYTWWASTICAGLPSKSFGAAQLYNHLDVLTTFTHCIVHHPRHESREYDRFIGVTIRITQLY